MPIVPLSQISWDPTLSEHKGRDINTYITSVVWPVSRCAACQDVLTRLDRISVIVDVTQQSTEPLAYKHYNSYVCHARCRAPELRVITDPSLDGPGDIPNYGVRTTIEAHGFFGVARTPAFVFGHTSAVTVRAIGGERTSAGMAVLLDAGFQLHTTPDMVYIFDEYADVPTAATLHVDDGFDLVLEIRGVEIFRLSLDRRDPDDHEWIRDARLQGRVLGLVGENLAFAGDDTDVSFDLEAAAALGTLAFGSIPFHY